MSRTTPLADDDARNARLYKQHGCQPSKLMGKVGPGCASLCGVVQHEILNAIAC